VGTVREGSPVHGVLLDYAAENDVDLIVMGTHGRHGLDRWLLGSVTGRIVRTSEGPVPTVRPATDRGEADDGDE
jgi:nucleotide-binding universal stress UspA family protein